MRRTRLGGGGTGSANGTGAVGVRGARARRGEKEAVGGPHGTFDKARRTGRQGRPAAGGVGAVLVGRLSGGPGPRHPEGGAPAVPEARRRAVKGPFSSTLHAPSPRDTLHYTPLTPGRPRQPLPQPWRRPAQVHATINSREARGPGAARGGGEAPPTRGPDQPGGARARHRRSFFLPSKARNRGLRAAPPTIKKQLVAPLLPGASRARDPLP